MMPREENQALIEVTIVELGLHGCANIVICNWYPAPVGDQVAAIRGGSVSMAMEILMKPRLLILDEPTIGLIGMHFYFISFGSYRLLE
jgi:hypothetical protein